ncbi:MAG TPA: hypothetical protein VIM71_00560 [Lacunisphaera sp.]
MNKPWVVILVLIGIFAAGGVTGGFVTAHMFREKITNRPVPEEWAPRHIKRLVERLNLTPEQTEQVGPIVKRNMEQLGRLRNQSMTETRVIVETMQREITEKLTPEQRVKFEQFNREIREKVERARREKGGAGRPGGPPPPEKDRTPLEKPSGT